MLQSALIVDDDEFVRTVLTHQLRQCGVQDIHAAGDGDEATQLLKQKPEIDLILLDLLMPGADGVELLRRLGEQKATMQLILTSSADAKLLHTVENLAVAHGLNLLGSLRKPVSPSALRALVERAQQPRAMAVPLRRDAVSQLRLETALREQRIVPYFQPKIDARSGRLRSVEALARWRDADGNMVPPSQFVATAEASGLIGPLTEAICSAAIATLQDWERDGFTPELEINLSAWSLHDLHLPDTLAAMARHHHIDPRRITLELTESALVSDGVHALDTLTRLCIKGFHLAVDDFGTGFATLALLRALPLSELKIDQSFVSRACTDFESRAIVDSCIELAHSFSLTMVAEGVEDAATATLMRERGVDLLQGFHYSPALPPAVLLDWWRARGY